MGIHDRSDEKQNQLITEIFSSIDLEEAIPRSFTDAEEEKKQGLAGPFINMIKLVSADNGLTWQEFDAPLDPFLSAGSIPIMGVAVSNGGVVPLTDILGTGGIAGLIGVIEDLLKSEADEAGSWGEP